MILIQRLWEFLFGSAPDAEPPALLPPPPDAPSVAVAPAATATAERTDPPLGAPAHSAGPDGGPVAAPPDSETRGGGPRAVSPAPVWWLPVTTAGSADDEPVAESAELDADLQNALDVALGDPRLELPRLPHTTDRALLMLRSENADYRALAQLIGEDPALTAQILRVANSALYGGNVEFRSLERAFTRLGQRTLRGVILNASLRSLSIRLGGPKRTLSEEVWRQMVATGVIMGAAAGRCGLDEDEAFLAGLLHDIGHFVVLLVAHSATRKRNVTLTRALFDRAAAQWHERAGARLAEAWKLPAPFPQLIEDHHRLPAAGEELEKPRLLILLADVVAALLRYTPFHPYDFFATPCVQRLGFTDDAETQAFLRALPGVIRQRVACA
jgi:HD-like signal output (HDOD) protein